jgi:predicted 3-demethylubiquinone-9 3-methyltransferase (glyoxalase superfamily)
VTPYVKESRLGRRGNVAAGGESAMEKIVSCLWFEKEAEEAARLYTSVFKDSKLGQITRYGTEGQETHGGQPGSVMTVEFEILGRSFVALNGGPIFKFNEAVSFQVICETQEEVDHYWEKLSQGGDEKAQQCGWLKDKFGLSWQVVPAVLPKLLSNKDAEKAGRVMRALLQMKKLDIAALERASRGEAGRSAAA